nr:uncharacterized protein LOC117275911 [Nicotiana tomentosiformis]
MSLDLDAHKLLVMGDSDLLIRQPQGEWETQDIKIIPYRQCVKDLSKRFKTIEFRYIPRFHNELAGALATLASMLPYPGNTHIDPLEIQVQNQHDYCNTIEIEPDGYRTTARTSVGATPYLLVYRTKAVIPAEVIISSLRIIVESEIEDTEWVDAKEKFSPNMQWPYIIKKVLAKGALQLVDEEGRVPEMTINANAVKRYYV